MNPLFVIAGLILVLVVALIVVAALKRADRTPVAPEKVEPNPGLHVKRGTQVTGEPSDVAQKVARGVWS